MNAGQRYTPAAWETGAIFVFIAIVVLADSFLVAWVRGNEIGLTFTAGIMAGFAVSIAWAVRHYVPGIAATLFAMAAGMVLLLSRSSVRLGLATASVTAATWFVWFLVYDVWFTGQANAEFVSPVITFGQAATTGRALIVYHRGRGEAQLQRHLQEAFAEGLVGNGWQVDLTTASRETPTDLSRYDLLVLGAQAYNWSPARPIVEYLDRMDKLNGKAIVAVVSGGGMADRAMRILQARIVEAGGSIVDAFEIWTSRSNEARYGIDDPEAIMRRAGSHLRLALRKAG
jgi:hypothetical protein